MKTHRLNLLRSCLKTPISALFVVRNSSFTRRKLRVSSASRLDLEVFKQLLRTIGLITVLVHAFAFRAEAGAVIMRLGPASAGTGGSNPLGIPPSATDIDLSIITESKWEASFSVVPGILLGKRIEAGRFYTGLGGGVIIDANGVGLGPYTSFGWETKSLIRFGIEYKQAIGVTATGLIFPYALRVGFGVGF